MILASLRTFPYFRTVRDAKLSLTLFEKTPILQALQPFGYQNELPDHGKQLILFDF